MSSIDFILLIFIGLLAIFGFIRGVVSQAMSLLGLIAAYFFAEPLSQHIVSKIAFAMGSTETYAKPFAVLWAAVLIYIACRLIGFGIEKIFVNSSESIKMLNRLGGGFLGAVKGCLVLLIAFYILRLVPQETLEAHAPKISQSKLYQFFAHNTLLDQKYIETLAAPLKTKADEMLNPKVPNTDDLIKSITDPKNKKVIEKTEAKMNNAELNKILQDQTAPKKPQPKNNKTKK